MLEDELVILLSADREVRELLLVDGNAGPEPIRKAEGAKPSHLPLD
jgi:hypothetical protein